MAATAVSIAAAPASTAAAAQASAPSDFLERAAFSASRSSHTTGEPSSVLLLLSGLLEVTIALLSIARSLAAFLTLTVPATVYTVLHYSLTLQLSFPFLAGITLAGLVGAFFWFRTSMRVYEKVREPPLDSDAGFSLHPDLANSDPLSPFGLFGSGDSAAFGATGSNAGGGGTLHDYLDEFLQAIRIFGYLERPVFHDLARHLQTRRLISGDRLSLDHDSCFYIVIDGLVSVYAPTPPSAATANVPPAMAATGPTTEFGTAAPPLNNDDDDDDAALEGYQLLHQVGNGGTLSSLFTILKLFTEGSARPRAPPPPTTPKGYPPAPRPIPLRSNRPGSIASTVDLGASPDATPMLSATSYGPTNGFGRSVGPDPEQMGEPLEMPPSSHHLASRQDGPFDQRLKLSQNAAQPSASSHDIPPFGLHSEDGPVELTGTVALAKVDTTLAVIPAEAFRRLTKKYPNSAAHILQGLTKEVMRAEQVLNQTADTPLPSSFYESGAIERLRQRFVQVYGGIPPTPPAAQGVVPGVDPRARAAERVGPPLSPPRHRGQPHHSPRPSRTGLTLSSLDLQGPDAAMFSSSALMPIDTPSTTVVDAKPHSSRRASQSLDAGDLFTSTPGGAKLPVHPPLHPSRASSKNVMQAPTMMRNLSSSASTSAPGSAAPTDAAESIGWAADGQANFDLKEAVLHCIANTLGLQSPPTSAWPASRASHAGETANQAAYGDSPLLSAQDLSTRNGNGNGGVYGSAWGQLTMLAEVTAASRGASGDDTGSPTPVGAGRVKETPGFPFPHSTLSPPFENDVEIKFFHAGDTLIAAGEREAGLFYVVDGHLDVTIPTPSGLAARRAADSPRPASASSATSPETAYGTGRANSEQAHARAQQGHAPKPLYSIGRGGVAGYLATLLGAPSYVDVKARTDCYVGLLPARALDKLMDRRPTVLLGLCRRLLSLLSPTLLQIDTALDWQHVNAGQVIYRQGEVADKFYLVINGRLRAIAADQAGSSHVHIANEFGMGDSVGELEVVTDTRRTHTLHAIRDTELACIPVTLFRAVSALEPSLSIQLAQIIARHVSTALVQHGAGALPAHMPMSLLSGGESSTVAAKGPKRPGTEMWRSNTNLKTVAIVPVTREVPIAAFARRLQNAFEPTTGEEAAYLNQSAVMGVLGRNAFNRMGKLKLAGWLADQEAKHRMVLYVVDTAVSSPWAQTSIRQADCVLLVGFGDDPAVGEYERLLLAIKTTARKELVLLHPERSVPPGSTRAWLRTRPWVSAHHHVEMPGIKKVPDNGVVTGSRATSASFNWSELGRRAGTMTAATMPPLPPLAAVAAMAGVDERAAAVRALKRLRGQIGSRLQRYREKRSDDSSAGARPAHLSDFSRLARRLCGQSVGLVLGGGGARGIAHLGVISALEEAGVPIDLIGGTSIGSFVGGLYAKEAGLVPSYGRAKKFAGRMASLWRFVLDLTYPYASYTTGHEFNRGVFKAFRDTHIEDMWLPFFCNTTNVTWSRMEIHTTGYAWRFIRGSMTLAGLVPPLVDEGDMLVDGGYMDNLPVSTMFAAGAARVFAVDVGSIDDTSPRDYGDTLSGWWLLVARWVLPWVPGMGAVSHRIALIPSIPDIQARLAYVSSVRTLEEAKNAPGCFYMRMPVEDFGTLEFGSFDAIHKAGHDAATTQLTAWRKQGKLPTAAAAKMVAYAGKTTSSHAASAASRTGIRARRNSV